MNDRIFSLLAFVHIFVCLGCGNRERRGDLGPKVHTMREIAKEAWYEEVDSTRANWPEHFGFGQQASLEDIRALDIDVNPAGEGLPVGNGHVKKGLLIYREKCVACHGLTGTEGPYDVLVSKGGREDKKAIGNYWPYSTTLFDYIRRAMPFNAPGSLTDEEVYHLTAYLLFENGLIDSTAVINSKTLPKVDMPARSDFVLDDRRGGPEIR